MVGWPTLQQKQVIWRALGYEPFPLQMPFHASTARVRQLVGAEGAGKSLMTARELVAAVPFCDLTYLVGQEFENTRREFEYIRDDLLALGMTEPSMISDPKNPPWGLATLTGCRIVTISVAKCGAAGIIARGEEPDAIALLEAGVIVGESVFNAAWRRISRSKGQLILSGTLRDDFGWYARLEETLREADNPYGGQTFSVPAWANLSVYPQGESDPQIMLLKRTLPPDEYSRTVEARTVSSLAAIFGGVFQPEVHVRPCPFQQGVPVTLAIDPGWFPSAYAVAVMQRHGDEAWQIDEVYENMKTHEEVIEICKGREWWVAVRGLVGDVAMAQHQADRSAREVWQAKTGLPVRGRLLRVQEGIDRHRSMLQQRRLFHDPKCVNTIWEYRMYRRRVDRDGNPVSDTPLDTANHCLKAISYYLADEFGLSDYQPGHYRRVYQPADDPWARTLLRR